MIAAAILVAVILCLLFLRCGIAAEYDSDGLTLKFKLGPVAFKLLPRKTKQDKKLNKYTKEAKPEKKPGTTAGFKEMLPLIRQALARLNKKLTIKELKIYTLVASEDPASAALQFGAVNAGYGIILPLLENKFKIKKRDLRSRVDFEVNEPYIYVKVLISLFLWEAVYAFGGLLKGRTKVKPDGRKSERRLNNG